jgi:hypothetical protein
MGSAVALEYPGGSEREEDEEAIATQVPGTLGY